ncbi:MAG: ribose ABC transporter permease [Acidimicrobiales bacterium]
MTVADTSTQEAALDGRESGSEDGRGGGQRVMVYVEKYALVALFLVMMVFFTFWSKTSKTFLTTANVKNVLGNQAVIGILAMAIIIPLVCGEFDFSVGSLAGLTQVLCAGFMARLGMPWPMTIVVAIAIGAFVGLSNGNTVARVGVNSLIVTLGIATVLVGIVEWYTKGKSIITGIAPGLVKLGTGDWLGIPRTVYFLIVVAAGVYYLLEHTPYGRYLHSIGSNADAARLVGLRVERLVLISFVLSGALAGLAGILLVARNGGASPQVGTVGDTLQALSAAFLGATAIRPGRFNVVGTLVAIFFLAFSVTGLSLAGVQNWVNDVFNGAALFVAVLISTIIGRRRAGIA